MGGNKRVERGTIEARRRVTNERKKGGEIQPSCCGTFYVPVLI